MDKLKWFTAAAAAVSLSAAMTVSTMAEDMIFTYDKNSGWVTMSGVKPSGNKQTLLVLKEDINEVKKEAVVQIDQQDGIIKGFKLPAGLDEATYYIRIGGSDGTIQSAVFEIDEQKVTLKFGDSDMSGKLDGKDTIALARAIIESTKNKGIAGKKLTTYGDALKNSGEKIIFADSTEDGKLDGRDTIALARAITDSTKSKGIAGAEVQIPASELQADQ